MVGVSDIVSKSYGSRKRGFFYKNIIWQSFIYEWFIIIFFYKISAPFGHLYFKF